MRTEMEPAICFEMFFPEKTPEEKLGLIANYGFRNAEFWGFKDKDLDGLAKAAAASGMKLVNFSGHRAGDLIDAATHSVVLAEFAESAAAARKIGVSLLMVLSNALGPAGEVLHPSCGLPEEKKYRSLVEGLAKVLERLPSGLTLVLEPLNTAVDHPGYYLTDLEKAVRVLRDVGSPRLKLLCDFYHQAVMGDDPEELVRKYAEHFGHVHIADYPGRHEPGTGKGRWKEVLRLLRDRGYSGYVGFECSPQGSSEAALESIRNLWREALGS